MHTHDAYTCTRTSMLTHAYMPFHATPCRLRISSIHPRPCNICMHAFMHARQAMLTGVYQVTVMRDASRLTLPMLEMQLEEEAVGERMNRLRCGGGCTPNIPLLEWRLVNEDCVRVRCAVRISVLAACLFSRRHACSRALPSRSKSTIRTSATRQARWRITATR
jgi:hypothetical protein